MTDKSTAPPSPDAPAGEPPATAEEAPDAALLDADVVAHVGEQYARCRETIRRRASFKVRYLRGHAREEAIAEIEAFSWYEFLKLTARGDDPAAWVSSIVD